MKARMIISMQSDIREQIKGLCDIKATERDVSVGIKSVEVVESWHCSMEIARVKEGGWSVGVCVRRA